MKGVRHYLDPAGTFGPRFWLSGLAVAILLICSFAAGYSAGQVDDDDDRDRNERDDDDDDKDGKEKKVKRVKKTKRSERRDGDRARLAPALERDKSSANDRDDTAHPDHDDIDGDVAGLDDDDSAGRELTFTGACDASGAVPIDRNTFALADDEDNLIRIYDVRRAGAPIVELEISETITRKPEADFEAATSTGKAAYWLSSHGRSKKGVLKEDRLLFFSSSIPSLEGGLEVIGEPYRGLLGALERDPRFAPFQFSSAQALLPNAPGGLNIEGMTASPTGTLIIGFRNPIPKDQALLVELLNPAQVPWGDEPKFSAPILLPLGGRGVRALSWWHGKYLISAGPRDVGTTKLYRWDGPGAQPKVVDVDLGTLNPEAFFTPEDRDRFLVISDDGTQMTAGTPCKKIKDNTARSFRAVWVRLDDEER